MANGFSVQMLGANRCILTEEFPLAVPEHEQGQRFFWQACRER